MGRLVGVPHFSTPAAKDEDRDDLRTFRKARREQQEQEQLSTSLDPMDDKERRAKVEVAKRMQKRFTVFHDQMVLVFIVRRTLNSLNWRGDTLLSLPGYDLYNLLLNLNQREDLLFKDLEEKANEV